MGSWSFIIVQSAILFVWITANLVGAMRGWDPYPFILLNLALSFQAAYAAPVIMMSRNRQQDIDRKAAQNNYRINVKAELEIELLHEKIDQLHEREVLKLMEAVRMLTDLLEQSASGARGHPWRSGDRKRCSIITRDARSTNRHGTRLCAERLSSTPTTFTRAWMPWLKDDPLSIQIFCKIQRR